MKFGNEEERDLFPLFMDRPAAQGGIVLEPFDALLLQLLVLGREITGSRLAFLGRLGAFQNNLFAHGIKWVVWSRKAYRARQTGQASSLNQPAIAGTASGEAE